MFASVLLLPVAVVVALVGLVLLICLGVLFTPIFIFLILPFLIVAKCRSDIILIFLTLIRSKINKNCTNVTNNFVTLVELTRKIFDVD
jgi:hypothetical protein